jgi:glycosyltransferase involved in cell wall biosynthesis
MQAEINPRVSVLLPFHDAAATLGECIDSILKQSLAEFEVIAIDDHSSDGSVQLLERYNDKRVRIIKNPQRGLVSALNTGLAYCNAPLVARLDADDIMYPQRLKKQYEYLRLHPDVVLVATRARKFPEASILNGYREYMRWQNSVLSEADIRNQIYIESPFAHPSVMFRRDSVIAAGAYRQGKFPEDYELWLRLMHQGYRMEKLSEVLIDWRESDKRLSRVSDNYSREAFDTIRADYLCRDARIQNKKIAFWGAGRKTRQRASHLVQKGYRPHVWIDVDPKKIGNHIQGIEVVAPGWLQQVAQTDSKPFVLSYLTSHGARDAARDFLQQHGYTMGEDFLEVG